MISELPDLPATSITRRELLLHSALAACAMRDELQLPPTSRLALYMPNHPLAVIWTEAAKRLGLAYVAVAGGTVAAVLAERIDDTGASLVVSSTELQSTVNAALEQLSLIHI
mgnify:FL=1